jgi:hypothetical protein
MREKSQFPKIEAEFNAILDKSAPFRAKPLLASTRKTLGFGSTTSNRKLDCGYGEPSRLRGKSTFMGLISTGS